MPKTEDFIPRFIHNLNMQMLKSQFSFGHFDWTLLLNIHMKNIKQALKDN